MSQRYGAWIETYSGNKFYPLDPRPEDIVLEDIAHGLSLMSRFNGQCKYFFSVAQHSLNVQKELKILSRHWDRKDSIKIQLLGILHDSSECLGISDICSPAKRFMPEYREIEKKIQDTVWKAFGLEHSEDEYDIVNSVDSAMAAFEAKELMKCRYWDITYSYLVHCNPESKAHIDLSLRDMQEIEEEFLQTTQQLLEQYKQL